jgi:hypothetical protein
MDGWLDDGEREQPGHPLFHAVLLLLPDSRDGEQSRRFVHHDHRIIGVHHVDAQHPFDQRPAPFLTGGIAFLMDPGAGCVVPAVETLRHADGKPALGKTV